MRNWGLHSLSMILAGSLAWTQQSDIAPQKPAAPVILRPYLPTSVPAVRLANSPRLRELVRAGTLYLRSQDAIALALENNIDLEIARYNPIVAQWRVERAQAGGALPGVPNNASQAGSVAIGQGVTGSQQAAGVRIISTGSNRNNTANATISQIGPVAQTLDPNIQEASTFSHTTTPQPNVVQSFTPVLITDTRAHSAAYQQGFLTGGSATLKYTDNYLNENSPTDVLNPSSAPNLFFAFQQNMLRSFGIAVNARAITVSKINVRVSDLNFKTQVIGVVTKVLDDYYGLAADYEDVKAKQNATDVARTFLANVRQQIKLGSLAPSEAINAESQVVASGQALVDSQVSLQHQEIQLKNLLSRNGDADPVLAATRILPVDTIALPAEDDLLPLSEMVKLALANRSDLAASRANDAASEASALGTRNGLQPTLQVFGAESRAGLSGARPAVPLPGLTPADPYFVGGIGTGLGQVFRRNFPTDRIGTVLQGPIRNWQAQADYAIDQLQLRQSDLTTRKTRNQVEVDVANCVVALRQARARYDAAVKNRVLQQQLFDGEERRYNLGASTPYNVIQQQRDLVAAQSAEMAALVSYSTARIALDQTLGRTLEVNHVSIGEAREGRVPRVQNRPQGSQSR
jgi:outer membrane protein